MQKSPDAFRTISEVASDLDLPQHVLRFWETRFSPIRPLKRGGGRRYYRPDDVDLLKGIRQLLYGQGYTIKGVQRILKEDGLRFVQAIGRGEQGAAPPKADLGPEEDGPEYSDFEEAELDSEPETSERVPDGRVAGAASLPDQERGPAFPSPVPQAKPGLEPREADLLRAALDELMECRRILEMLRAE